MNDDLHMSPNGRKMCEEFEGCILQAYDDASDHIVKAGQYVHGTLTIGYGHTDAANALNAGNYQLADQDFMLYDRAQGKVLKGLSKRRQAEKDLFHTPVAL